MIGNHHVPLCTILAVYAVLSAGCGQQSPKVDPARLKSFAALPEAPISGAADCSLQGPAGQLLPALLDGVL